MGNETGAEMTLIEFIGALRSEIKRIGKSAQALIIKAKSFEPETSDTDKGEIIANTTLAYRHLEDCAMRLGKAIQAYEGGKSIYDNNDTQRVANNGWY